MWHGLVGIVAFVGLAWLVSENRWQVKKRYIISGLAVQVALAIIITQFPLVRGFFEGMNYAIEALKNATTEGTQFLFGYLGGGTSPFAIDPENKGNTFIFAIQALPMIMVVSAISMLLFHWRILPVIVNGLSKVFKKLLNLGGAVGVGASAKVFLGNIEAPLLIRPYLKDLTRSELFMLMTCGMATTSATVMALYCTILQNTIHNPIAHILTASVISIPAALTIARIIVPQTSAQSTDGNLVQPYEFSNAMDAISKGTVDGMKIVINVAAMLLVVIALVALVNTVLGKVTIIPGVTLSLQNILGWFMAPVTWLMGVPWQEAPAAGQLLGTKTALNEVIAFLEMAKLPEGTMSPKSTMIMTYALCGFANLSSIGIMIGGLGAMVPERRSEIVNLGFKSILSGTLATCLSGTIMGLLAALSPVFMK